MIVRIGVMQPYFFPYLGYFQLINNVDRFIILDDVNFIVRGWICRNRILIGGQPYTFSLPVKKSSQNKLINEIELSDDYNSWAIKFAKTLRHAYSKSPFFDAGYELVEEILACPERKLSLFVVNSLKKTCNFLGIDTEIEETAAAYDKNGRKGAERIVDICVQNHATTYVNPPGGKDLYSSSDFEARGISLEFQVPNIGPYQQGKNKFISGLSVLDFIMWCGRPEKGTIF